MEKIPPIVKTFANDKHEITLHIPNVRYAKENDLLLKKHGITNEMIEYNMKICGFDVVAYGEYKGAVTKITAKCCNVQCENINEKKYSDFIHNERYPLCKDCQLIINGINPSNKRPIVAIKDDEKIVFESTHEAGRRLNISPQNIYNTLKNGRQHKSGYRFEFLD